MGDGILVYFGYPQANEDDATRAVQTGLELVRSIHRLNERLSEEKDIRLSIRVGIHTGLVVIGEIGSDDKRSLALGTTPNVAARLQDRGSPAGHRTLPARTWRSLARAGARARGLARARR